MSKLIETYTVKHIALAEYLTYLHIDDIENEDDIGFNAYDAYYLVLDREEAWETVYDNILQMLDDETYTFPIKQVIKVLKVSEEELQLFFLADVLTGDLIFGKEIGGETLLRFVEKITTKEQFAFYYTDYLFDNNLSGQILDSRMKNVTNNGFHIYER